MPQILVLTSKGLDYLLADEITELLPDTTLKMGVNSVSFEGDLNSAYKLCLHSNLSSKVLLQLHAGNAGSADELYELVQAIDWSMHIKTNATLAVDFVGTSGSIRNTQFGAVKVKDAIVDQLQEDYGSRPNVEKYRPDVRIHVRLKGKTAVVYLDLSGEGLHQRGYRSGSGAAPLKEHIACAMLVRSGWLKDTSKPLLDPFCGSGTILIEAARMAKKIAPGLSREYWGFNGWLGHNPKIWTDLKEQAEQQICAPELTLMGSDLDHSVLNKAKENIRHAGFADEIRVKQVDATQISMKAFGIENPGVIVSNPPYGERMGALPELVQLYMKLGNQVKQNFAHWHLAILCSDPELLKQLKLGYKKQFKINNGSISCVLNTYEVSENETVRDVSAVASVFSNRLQKNLKGLKSWLNQQSISCFRLYDADIPEYNVAIDKYQTDRGDYLVVYEYAAPKDIPESTTRRRLQEVVMALPQATGVSADNIILKVREKKKGTSQYQKMAKRRERLIVKEGAAKLLVNLWDYLDTGIFLDHRRTREVFAKQVKGKSVLNLFAYTGSVSVQAALAGAKSITTVDMSKTYIEWAQDNFKVNRLKGRQYEFVQADCLQWTKRSHDKFDVIFIDPPTFSNSKRMDDTFDVQRDHINLISEAKNLLNEGGLIMFTNNKRHFKMDFETLEKMGLKAENISKQTLPKDFARNPHIHNSWFIRQA